MDLLRHFLIAALLCWYAPGGASPAVAGRGRAGRPGRGGMAGRGPRFRGRGDPSDTLIRLVDERPPGRRFRGGGPGRFRGWRGQAEESYYLEFRAGEEITDVYSIPRALRVTLTMPTPIPPPDAGPED